MFGTAFQFLSRRDWLAGVTTSLGEFYARRIEYSLRLNKLNLNGAHRLPNVFCSTTLFSTAIY